MGTCESRDPKGFFQKTRFGQIAHFTGIDFPYEVPAHPEIRLDTSRHSVEECVESPIGCLLERQLIARND